MNEFADLEEQLARYRPCGPSEAARRRTMALIASGAGASGRRWRLTAACAAIALLAAGGWWTFRSGPDAFADRTVPATFAEQWASNPRQPMTTIAAHTPVSVVMLTDWQCPGCPELYLQLASVIESYGRTDPGKVSLALEDWPWSSQCNPFVPVTMHPAACDAAVAVRMARQHGREREMIEWLVSHRQDLSAPATIDQIKSEVRGLIGRGADFAAEYDAALAAVREDVVRAAQLHSGSTPAVYVNGIRVNPAKAREVNWAIALELSGRKR